jgi:hypothetical protein
MAAPRLCAPCSSRPLVIVTRCASLRSGSSWFFQPGWWQVGQREAVMPGPSSVGSTQPLPHTAALGQQCKHLDKKLD